MGFIALGNADAVNMALGDAQVIGVWLGNIFVWPDNIYDCDNKLLNERQHGIKGYIGEKPISSGEHIFQIDRKYWPDDSREYECIVTDSQDASKVRSLQYEERNNYPYVVNMTRDYMPPHFDNHAMLVEFAEDVQKFVDFDDPNHHFFTAYMGLDPAGEDQLDD